MIIINSGEYIIPELQAEYGKLPPVMLPLGNRLLLSHQIELLKQSFPDERLILSLPENFISDKIAISFLESHSIEVVPVPEGFTLAESVLYVVNTVEGNMPESVRLLHGDTLLLGFPQELDIVAVASTDEDYGWEFESHSTDSELIWCGFFAFSSSRALVRALASAKGSFVDAVRSYYSPEKIKTCLVDNWLDLGHVNTYFKSRAKLTTQRSFNSLVIENGVVRKTGTPHVKIQAEANWFESLPANLKKYIPQLLSDSHTDKPFYALEYLPYLPLNELLVHGRNPVFFWNKIFKILSSLVADFSNNFNQNEAVFVENIEALYVDKTYERLGKIREEGSFDVDSANVYQGCHIPSLVNIAKDCIYKIRNLSKPLPGVLHGDLCFSNVMYDSRCNIIKVIDPRGIAKNNNFTIYGDQRYDLAKLAHSVIGLYDHIISGQYALHHNDNSGYSIKFIVDDRLLEVQAAFEKIEFLPGVTVRSIMPLVVLLFITMIPLHSDRPDRQEAMFANSLRLYKRYVEAI